MTSSNSAPHPRSILYSSFLRGGSKNICRLSTGVVFVGRKIVRLSYLASETFEMKKTESFVLSKIRGEETTLLQKHSAACDGAHLRRTVIPTTALLMPTS